MSGEGVGYLFALPIVIGGVAIAGAGLAAYGAVKAGAYIGKAAYSYYNKKKEERQEIIESGVRSELSKIHTEVEESLSIMNEMGQSLYQNIEKEMAAKNQELLDILKQADAEVYQDHLANMHNIQQDTTRKIEQLRKKFDREYAEKVETELLKVKQNTDQKMKCVLEQIKGIQESEERKEQITAEIARQYLDETKKILEALLNGFDVNRLIPEIRESMARQFHAAADMYNNKNYEGAIATAATLQMDVGEKVYELEKADIDWDISYQAALSAVDMVKNYLEAQQCFNEEAAEEIKKITGIEIPEELYDEEIADYCNKDVQGRNIYQKLLSDAKTLAEELANGSIKNRSERELRELTEQVYTVMYPEAMRTVQDGIMNMSNVFYRVQKANEFKDYLESKDFDVRLYFEDEDDMTSDIGIAVYNSATREKVVYTLSKQRPGESPNQVNIVYQLAAGDESNEARNQYYQKIIADFTGAEQMLCNQNTIGQTAANLTEEAKRQLQEFDSE